MATVARARKATLVEETRPLEGLGVCCQALWNGSRVSHFIANNYEIGLAGEDHARS